MGLLSPYRNRTRDPHVKIGIIQIPSGNSSSGGMLEKAWSPHLQIGLLVAMLPLAVGAAHVLSGSCSLPPPLHPAAAASNPTNPPANTLSLTFQPICSWQP